MKKIVLFSLTLLVLLLLKPTLQVSAGRALPVRIAQGGEVDYEVANLSRSANDEVVWYSDGDDFTVSFQTSPFAASTFHVPARGSVSAGPVKPSAALGHYQYFVTDNTDGRSADLDLNIKP